MPTFKRKSDSEDDAFRASERKQRGSTEGDLPDFSALEPESDLGAFETDSGFSTEELRPSEDRIERAVTPEPAAPEEPSGGGIFDQIAKEAEGSSLFPSQPAEEAPRKKRYYSPTEVVRQKGCIGCGGMALVLPALLALVALAIVLF